MVLAGQLTVKDNDAVVCIHC